MVQTKPLDLTDVGKDCLASQFNIYLLTPYLKLKLLGFIVGVKFSKVLNFM